MTSIVKVIGNPGTGKTKYLVDHTASLINSGILAEEIAYLTFTKKAAREAMDRLVSITTTPRECFKWVKTLHSLAFYLLGITKDQMMTETDMMGLLDLAGIHDRQEGKQIIQMHTYSRMTGCSLMHAWDKLQGSVPVPWTVLMDYDDSYTRFKQSRGMYDFHDLLEKYLETPVIPKLHTVIVDEAQDLSPIQWAMIKLLSAKAHVLMLAGDPNQAIYEWCGADAGILQALEGEEIILPKSNRIPAEVQAVSRKVLQNFADPDRYPYEPASHPGQVHVLNHLVYSQLPLDKGSWMFLARNEIFLEEVKGYLHDANIASEQKGGSWTNNTNEKMMRYIQWYEKWLETGDISPVKLEKLRSICTNPTLSVASREPWYVAFNTLPANDRKFYASLKEGSPVILSTIHGSKGGEADNVVIYGDYTYAVHKQFEAGASSEYACLYVGVTRAKQRLYLVQPQRQFGYNWRMYT